MAAPLPVIAEVAEQEAVRQTVQLTLIQGGLATAEAAGPAVAGEATVGGAAGAGGILGLSATGVGTIVVVVVGLGALGYYLYSRHKTSESQSKPDVPAKSEVITPCPRAGVASPPPTATQTPAESPISTTQEEESEPKKCPPHDWYEYKPGKPPKEGMEEKQDMIDDLSKSPSRAQQMRGIQFEKDATDLNGKKRPIESTGRIYRCRRCGAEQEVDINFKDGQVAEAKSRGFNGVKNASKQAQRYTDLQAFLNKQNGTNFKPLAKLDDNLPDSDQSAAKYGQRGFQIEQLDTGGKR
ncbi:MAG: hypothetical protein WBQ94_12010 [Terracidiphilus sp.]